MGELLDARGLACPGPVVRTRGALKAGAHELEVLVDNPTARDNVCRFASSQGCRVEVAEEGRDFRIAISREAEGTETPRPSAAETEQRIVVILLSDVMGRGDDELGRVLLKAFLNTLLESDPLPWRMVLFNRGAMLAVEGEATVEALSKLHEAGVEILVCGTCLDYFCVKERLAVGEVSNMYEILSTMQVATNTLTI